MKGNVHFPISFRLACTILILMAPIGMLTSYFSSRNDAAEFIGIAIGGFIIGLFSFLITYFSARALIAGRLNALAGWAGRLADGDTEFKDYDESDDEIGRVSLKLERVREYLNQVRADMVQLNMENRALSEAVDGYLLQETDASDVNGIDTDTAAADLKQSLKALAEWANELADGNTGFKVSSGSNDETEEIGRALERIREYLVMQSENVQMIADGNLSNEIKIGSDKDVLSNAVNLLKNNILKLDSEMKLLYEAALEGTLSRRADHKGLNGSYREIVTNINEAMGCLVGILDTLPSYLMILDKDFKLKFANERNMNLIEKTSEEVFDGECYKTFGCDKDTCILKDCVKTNTRQEFIECNEHTKIWYQTQFIPIQDKQGKTRSYLEIANEITDLKNAEKTAVKQLDYQKNEIQKLINNLQDLADGDLNISSEVSEPDADTKEIAELFLSLNNSLMESTGFIKSVIDELTGILSKMAEKDISVGINRDYAGDFKALKDSINYIIEQFNRVFMEINSAADQVGMGADQVSASSMMLSQGASEQASSVEEISATVSTVAEQTKQNAENAKQANELSIKAKEFAQKGNDQMLGMLSAMSDIKESSKNIGGVIKAIDDIAFQTNILALNAAVEAARAGIHGKGFAVVAEEVRNLAARSANAAKETTEMIDNSIKKIEEGYKIANDTADALKKIVTGVSDTEAKVGLIAEASVRQEIAIGQINMGIHEISKVTQANTATAEESASVSEEMAGQAQMLKGMIHEFKLMNYDNRLPGRKMETKALYKIKL